MLEIKELDWLILVACADFLCWGIACFLNRPPCWVEGCSWAVCTVQSKSPVTGSNWKSGHHLPRWGKICYGTCPFIPKSCLFPGSLFNFFRASLWLWPVDGCCSVYAEVGKGKGERVGGWVRLFHSRPAINTQMWPHFILLPFYSRKPRLEFIWGSTRELDFTFTSFFLWLRFPYNPPVFCILEIHQHVLSAWWFLSIPSQIVTNLLHFVSL